MAGRERRGFHFYFFLMYQLRLIDFRLLSYQRFDRESFMDARTLVDINLSYITDGFDFHLDVYYQGLLFEIYLKFSEKLLKFHFGKFFGKF